MACTDWPAHENVDFGHEGLPAELSDSEALSEVLDWAGPLEEGENNDSARVGEWIQTGTGWHIEGLLSGAGWDAEAEPDFEGTSDCDEPLAFPPLDSGNYLGDVEWTGLLVRERGTLCMSLEMVTEDASELRYDILLYRLNACGDPIEIEVDEELEILGFGAGGDRTSWWKKVYEGDILGLVLAAYSPNPPPELEIPWKIALSLVDLPTEGVCPIPPWR